MAKEKSYLSGQLCYSVTHASVDPFLGEINIWSSVKDTAEGRGSATLSGKQSLCECLWYLLKTKVCRAQVHDAGKESKGESVDLHE